MSHKHPAVFFGQLSATSIDNRPVFMHNDDSGESYHERQSRSANLQYDAYKTHKQSSRKPSGVKKILCSCLHLWLNIEVGLPMLKVSSEFKY